MSLKFSATGPEFPEALINSLISGDVVFLCGAGVSAPQLPGFGGLVEKCFTDLSVRMTPAESASFESGRYEEVLGSLGRRLASPREMIDAVVRNVAVPESVDLSNHRTLLRLSKDLESRTILVTTNFDTFFERALAEMEGLRRAQALSLAGQDPPLPGGVDFTGLIHIHGRAPDAVLNLERTNLVVTSADYGDAYMRSGWASRFLFDLSRCKTIVLVGYSAGDAPVRYFLNVLEADRLRFKDLKPVYAFDAVEKHGMPDIRWEALAVLPIAYEYETDVSHGKRTHAALWRDLAELADLVERPRPTRVSWASAILSRRFDDCGEQEQDRVVWLFSGRQDLWSVAITSIHDPAWLDFFTTQKLWDARNAAWITATWVAGDLRSRARFKRAVAAQKMLGPTFTYELEQHVRRDVSLPEVWRRAWRLLASSPPPKEGVMEARTFQLRDRLTGPVVLRNDIVDAIEHLSPVLTFRIGLADEPSPTPADPLSLRDVCRPAQVLTDKGGSAELIETLEVIDRPLMILEQATAGILRYVGIALDSESISGDFDVSDYEVPSVEPHAQNAHHDGPVALVELIARVLPGAVSADRAAVRRIAETWRDQPGRLGKRLWLHALRNADLFSCDEAISGVAELDTTPFWQIKREVALAIRDRAGGACAAEVHALEKRVIARGATYFDRFEIEAGQPDWRQHARDAVVWLRLKMLQQAKSLSPVGEAELSAIVGRRSYLQRDPEDSDFFGSYVSGVQFVASDPEPFTLAAPDDRLKLAREIVTSPNFAQQQGWSAYCRSDPAGALDTLTRAPIDASNAPFWRDLVAGLAYQDGAPDGERTRLIQTVFETLNGADDAFVAPLIREAAALFEKIPRGNLPTPYQAWRRLVDIAASSDDLPLDLSRELYTQAINSPAGRLTLALIDDVNSRLRDEAPVEPELIQALEHVPDISGRQGSMVAAVFAAVPAIAPMVGIEGFTRWLKTKLANTSEEGPALRDILLNFGSLSPIGSKCFCAEILQGVQEIDPAVQEASSAAAKIIRPALAIVATEPHAADWGISVAETAGLLRDGPAVLREGALSVLSQWLPTIGPSPNATWSGVVGPLLSQIWPRERTLINRRFTRYFVSILANVGDAFPAALEQISPYLSPGDQGASLYFIEKSRLPEEFPRETLRLIWSVLGRDSTGDRYGLSKVLDRMVAAAPELAVDRRLQWLDQNSLRLE